MRGQSGGELFGIVVRATSDPAAGLHGTSRHVVIGILFVVGPGIPGHHGVNFQQADQENQPAHQLVEGNTAHVMVVVIQIELALQAKNRHELFIVAFVTQDVFADGTWRPQSGRVAHVIVGRTDQIAGVALLNELGDRSGREQRNIIGVGLHGEEHLAFVWCLRCRSLNDDLAGCLRTFSSGEPQGRRARDYVREEVAS